MKIKSPSKGPFSAGLVRGGGMNQMGGGGGGAGGGGGPGGGGLFGAAALARTNGLKGVGYGEVPGRCGGGIGKRYGVQYQASQPGLHGLGADEPDLSNILKNSDPVRLYVRSLQMLLAMPVVEQLGVWDFKTHNALTAAISSEAGGVATVMPWGTNPGVTGMMVGEILMRALETDAGFRYARVMLETLGMPTSDRMTAIQWIGGGAGATDEQKKAGWTRLGRILDAVVRYVIGAEGGRAYGDPMTKYKGYGSAAGAPLLSLLLIALV